MAIDSYFAPAERASAAELQQTIARLSQNPLMDSLLDSVGGLLAVLNAQRQILSVNQTLLALLNIRDPEAVLGLRPGEALGCVHSTEGPGGCGTSQACVSCGAVIAIIACQNSGQSEQRECVATVERDGQVSDMYFQVRCSPFDFRGERLLLLFLRDATIEQQRATLERTFFHDINNLIGALLMNSELLEDELDEAGRQHLAQRITQVSAQLAKEVEIQRTLSVTQPRAYQLHFQDVSLARSLRELHAVLDQHPASLGKTIGWPVLETDLRMETDPTLLQKVLCNMLLNAIEASGANQPVRFWIETLDSTVTFSVWNQQAIPPHIAPRIFQRNFSTKPGAGRGLGTYSMRLFGETYLKGQVQFVSSTDRGTVFSLALPVRPVPAARMDQSLFTDDAPRQTLADQVQDRR